ncbi:hypothetical protein GOB94_12290 [Granulicella sp. 5B5]|uniref:hypothetical protein n=1 Tax=Granulicella sp. 5B5 TaxID=1617967 RepID=UPI0015F5C52B|nr:hypothetical protein [Granulicella sp. 5B5]QMV19374.1 hypothetical protein GOB94_12290 [Granulicella sp. 5B5]
MFKERILKAQRSAATQPGPATIKHLETRTLNAQPACLSPRQQPNDRKQETLFPLQAACSSNTPQLTKLRTTTASPPNAYSPTVTGTITAAPATSYRNIHSANTHATMMEMTPAGDLLT